MCREFIDSLNFLYDGLQYRYRYDEVRTNPWADLNNMLSLVVPEISILILVVTELSTLIPNADLYDGVTHSFGFVRMR